MTKYQIMLVGYGRDGTPLAKVLVAERPSLKEIGELNARLLSERNLSPEQQSADVKFIKQVQNLIDAKHGPGLPFALERLQIVA